MRDLNLALVARHNYGGLKCFSDHHQDIAPLFPVLLWQPISDFLSRAQWCVIAGAKRMDHLQKPQILSHSGNAFKSLLAGNPVLKGLCMPNLWWPSVIKRGVNTLWPELLKYEALGARPQEPEFMCDWCAHQAKACKQTA